MDLTCPRFRILLCLLLGLSAARSAYAQASGPPQITQQPATQYAFEGATARFSVIATGAPPLFAQWYKDGSVLTNQTNFTLTLSNVRMTNVATYFVDVTNGLGTLRSSNAVLNVAGAFTPPIELIGFNSNWKFDQTGTNLGTAWRASGYDDSRFAVGQSVFWTGPFLQSLPEEGNTTLELTFNGTRVNTYYFRTHFQYPAVATNVLLLTSNLVDDGAVFYVNGAEVSRLRITSGAFNYQTFAANAPNNGTVYESILFPPGVVHTGDNVLAVEVHQSTAASTDLIFGTRFLAYAGNSEPLQIFQQPASRSVPEESRVQFRADVFGGGNVTYQWYKNGSPLPGATNQVLILPFVHPPDGGQFWFAATNAFNGVLSSNATLTVIPDTVPPGLAGAYLTNDFNTIALVFSEPLDPQSATNIANYSFSPSISVLSAQLVSSNLVRLTISGFDPQLAYTITVQGVRDLALPPNSIAANATSRVQIGLDVPSAGLLAVRTVFVIVMENQDWEDVQGSADCPYINNVILPMASYGTQFNTPNDLHPSEPNYIWMEAGTNFGIVDDQLPSAHRLATTNHLVTLLNNAGISWKTYQEDAPPGCPMTNRFPYLARHNPFVFFDDVTTDDTYCTNHIRPFSDLAGDLTNGLVARYNFITPNQTNDMHDLGTGSTSQRAQGDAWLSRQLPILLSSAAYTNDGAIFIVWDEGNPNGPIGMMVLSPHAKGGGYHNAIPYSHSSLLRSMQEIFQVRPFLGAAAFANTLSDLFIGMTLSASQDNGAVSITINNSLPGKINYLQASSDLLLWSTIRTNTGAATLTISDPDASAHTSRFYRVIQMP